MGRKKGKMAGEDENPLGTGAEPDTETGSFPESFGGSGPAPEAGEANMGEEPEPPQERARSGNPNESMQGYFKRVLSENPHWIHERSNRPIFDRWHQDHPGHNEVPPTWQNALTNAKTQMRKATPEPKKRPGRPRKERPPFAPAVPETPSFEQEEAPHIPFSRLHSLEEKIDEALIYARSLHPEALATVTELLRRARNTVIKMTGE